MVLEMMDNTCWLSITIYALTCWFSKTQFWYIITILKKYEKIKELIKESLVLCWLCHQKEGEIIFGVWKSLTLVGIQI